MAKPKPDADSARIEQKLLPAACELRDALTEKLETLKLEAAENHLQSPVRNLALHISGLLKSASLDFDGISDLIQLLTASAFHYRARKLGDYVGERAADANESRLRGVFESLTRNPDGGLRPFEAFRETVEREIFGIVFTAHPTFSISIELTRVLAGLAMSSDAKALLDGMREAVTHRHGNPDAITLDDEMNFALVAIDNVRHALRRAYAILFAVARDTYPENWRRLTPRLLTVASWVGYDLDGRSDIGWSETLKKRMAVERLALADYLAALPALESLDEVRDRLRQSAEMVDADMARLEADMDVAENVGAFSRPLVKGAETRLVDLGWVISCLDAALEGDGEHAPSLAVLRAEMANFGLAVAHTHVRLNANQLANAIRHDIELATSPEDPANRRRYLREIAARLDEVTPVTVNFGSIMRERTSAKRLMMLLAQFAKFVDSAEPVRFLIAECNSAFTVLTALYFAKLFGIDHRIDISPLFETSHALEHGHDIVAELLDNPHYAENVRRRGRLCIQTGYSDAGRFIGQIPASLAIERTRIKLADVLAKRNLQDVELVIFDTHGESIGRGAHPASFGDRLDFVYPPESRAAFHRAGIRVKQEVSFQGGDGYVYFADRDLAFATLCRLLEHALGAETGEAAGDPFYRDTDYSLEFFMAVKGFNERLMDDPDYAATLDIFGANLLYPTGSRSMKRQHEGGGQVELDHPSQVRAIPHNAILQQLGYLSNSISGLGQAIARDQERFAELYGKSQRLRRFMSLAAYARHLSSLDALHGYISLFDPTIWMRRAIVETDPLRETRMRELAHILRHSSRHEKMNRIYRRFLDDTAYLDAALSAEAAARIPKGGDCRTVLTLLHGVRLALIHELFLLTAGLPRFSNQAVSADDVIHELLHLNVEHAVAALRRGFPVAEPIPDPKAFGEDATYRTDADQGYEREHRELFDPIEQTYDMIRRIGTAITHIMGAVG